VEDVEALVVQNQRFIEACRQGSWSMLERVFAPTFSYMDGATGEVWAMERYIADLQDDPADALVIDQVVIHVAGDTAVVSARARSNKPGSSRYLDTYQRIGDSWLCVHACVWPLQTA
jgi:Domain of unknown function (DUF4440)